MPKVVDSASDKPLARMGTVTAGFRRGALIVESEDGRRFRLSWEGPSDSAREPRALPAGSYTVRGYRVLAEDPAGASWTLGSSGASLARFEVRAGARVSVPVDETLRLVRQWNQKGVSVAVLGKGQAGVTIYREGKRIPLGFRLTDSEGRVVQEGRLDYG